GTLIDLAPCLASHVRYKGKIALCGILREQGIDVKNVYEKWFYIKEEIIRDDWVCLAGERK
ncbi:MAG: 50S ribosomal protein L11 methyltransferase, partial [bacterium]